MNILIADVTYYLSRTIITFSPGDVTKIKSKQFSEFGSWANTINYRRDSTRVTSLTGMQTDFTKKYIEIKYVNILPWAYTVTVRKVRMTNGSHFMVFL